MEEKFPFEKIERKILIKAEEITNSKYGKIPEERSIKESLEYGIININKSQGPSSHQITDYVKKILEVDKAGHSGTLDPNVTGSLVIGLGRATRVIHNLLKAGKEYVCLMHLHTKQDETKIREIINSLL